MNNQNPRPAQRCYVNGQSEGVHLDGMGRFLFNYVNLSHLYMVRMDEPVKLGNVEQRDFVVNREHVLLD